MSSGNIHVGITTSVDKSSRRIMKRNARGQVGGGTSRIDDRQFSNSNPENRDYGAMSRQSVGCAPGNQSFPQKLLQLVGYRDPLACRDPLLRPHTVQAASGEK
ncbi:MAG: hypothetical protein JSS22_15665 [Proteobacteria bacterium]|nr:hypothetical protein [Pseudomonadota bacterium]